MKKSRFIFMSILSTPSYPLSILVGIWILNLIFSPVSNNSIFKWLIDSKVLLILLGFWLIYSILHTTSDKVVKVLFNPCSPIITLIIGWLLTLLVTSKESNDATEGMTKMLIDFFLEKKSFILILLACWLIITIMYTNNEQELMIKDDKIKELEKSILEKDNQLNQSSGIILNKYGEFARFNRKNRFNEVLESFVNNNDLVDSAQIYKYSSKFNNKDYLNIRLSYEEGYAYDGIEINNILQGYYKIGRKEYTKFKEIVKFWKRILVCGDEYIDKEKKSLEENLLNDIEELLTQIVEKLQKIESKDRIEEADYTMYAVASLLIRLLWWNNDEISAFENIVSNSEIDSYLKNGKRTGVLGSILLEDSYIFKHEGKSLKKDRFYFTFHLEVYGQNYIVLFAIAEDEITETDKWNIIFENLKEDFIKRLKMTGCNI